MKKILTLIIFIIFTSVVYAKYPKVFVSTTPKTVHAGEKMEITLGVVAKKGSKIIFPKITQIGGYKVLSKKASVSYSIKEIDNKKVPLTKRVLNLTIKPTKSFDVDEFTIKIDNKEYKSVPFRVKVIQKKEIVKQNSIDTNQNANETNTLFFKMSSSKKEVVVGESFIVKVELFEPLDYISSDIQYTPPLFNGLKAQPLGDGKTLEQGNKVIRVIEYLVTPTKAGNFVIKPAVVKIGIELTPQAQSPFAFFGNNMQWKTIKTNSLNIKVKKIPDGIDFVGLFRLKETVESKYAKANKPFSYILEIDGIGNLDNIKEPEYKIDGVTSYSDDAKIEHIFRNNKIYSKFTKKYIFISDKDFTIPTKVFKVYSPDSKKIYTIKTKPHYIKIRKTRTIAEALSGSNLNLFKNQQTNSSEKNSTTKYQQKIEELNRVENLLFDKLYYKRKYRIDGYPFSALIGAFLLGILIGIGSLILSKSIIKVIKKATGREREFKSYEEALKILYPHTTKSKNIETMVENLYEIVNGNTDLKIDDYVLNKMIKRVKRDEVNNI